MDFFSISTPGVAVGIGTRVGKGCTSGHGICGLPRFSTRSWKLGLGKAGDLWIFWRSKDCRLCAPCLRNKNKKRDTQLSAARSSRVSYIVVKKILCNRVGPVRAPYKRVFS